MNNHDLDEALRRLAACPLPDLPASFRHDVWREIRARSVPALGWQDMLLDLMAWMISPRQALAALALAVAVGVSISWWTLHSTPTYPDMAVFSPRAPGLYLGASR